MNIRLDGRFPETLSRPGHRFSILAEGRHATVNRRAICEYLMLFFCACYDLSTMIQLLGLLG